MSFKGDGPAASSSVWGDLIAFLQAQITQRTLRNLRFFICINTSAPISFIRILFFSEWDSEHGINNRARL
jgi:hypothetical protein